MRLDRIDVKKLFDTYDYKIDLKQKDRVTLLHAPNGFGKTTILKLIKGVIEGDMIYLDETPFKQIILHFDNGDSIKVTKDHIFGSFFEQHLLKIRNSLMTSQQMISIPLRYEFENIQTEEETKNENESKKYLITVNAKVVANAINRSLSLHNNTSNGLINIRLKDILESQGVLSEIFKHNAVYNNLEVYREYFNIHIIESNRLYKTQVNNTNMSNKGSTYLPPMPYIYDSEKIAVSDSIKVYSKELIDMISETRSEYGNVSEVLDRTFPKRVLEKIMSKKINGTYTDIEIKKYLQDLEKQRITLEDLGLLNHSEEASLPENIKTSLDARKFLTTYIKDTQKKLSVYDDIKDKLDLLLETINHKYKISNKKVILDRDNGLRFVSNNNKDIPIDKLSSGEKNEFILFYELIFKVNNGSIILIDEPEISLHISWQQEFVKELIKICDIKASQAVIATHSPHIVDERWDLLVDMEEQKI